MALTSALFSSVVEFTSALVVSFTVRLITVHISQMDNCYFAMALSSLLVAKAHVTGTSHLMYALFSALQLGFGLATGEASCGGLAMTSRRHVRLPAFHIDGICSELTAKSGTNASSVVAAFAVGVSRARCCKFRYCHHNQTLCSYSVFTAAFVNTPGLAMVQGVAAMPEKGGLSGMGFVFDMMVVGLSITIGLPMAKLIVPQTYSGDGKEANTSTTLAQDLEKEEEAWTAPVRLGEVLQPRARAHSTGRIR
eukprot:SM000083S22799  [mRNA]  locus=s83:467781:470345:- [translate_table: standard]